MPDKKDEKPVSKKTDSYQSMAYKNYFLFVLTVSIRLTEVLLSVLLIVSDDIGGGGAVTTVSDGIVSRITLSEVVVLTLVSFLQLRTVSPISINEIANFIILNGVLCMLKVIYYQPLSYDSSHNHLFLLISQIVLFLQHKE